MILKIYFVFSFISLVLVFLTTESISQKMIRKYGKEVAIQNESLSEKILGIVKKVIMSFIPIYHLLLIFIIMFLSKKIEDEFEKDIAERIKSKESKL